MKRILSIFFLLVFAYQSIGQSINYHYCHGELTSVSIIEATKCCCKPNLDISTCSPIKVEQDVKITKPDCCSTTSTIQLTEVVNEKITTNPIHIFLVEAVVYCTDILTSSDAHTAELSHYYTPILIFDIPVKIQSFLI